MKTNPITLAVLLLLAAVTPARSQSFTYQKGNSSQSIPVTLTQNGSLVVTGTSTAAFVGTVSFNYTQHVSVQVDNGTAQTFTSTCPMGTVSGINILTYTFYGNTSYNAQFTGLAAGSHTVSITSTVRHGTTLVSTTPVIYALVVAPSEPPSGVTQAITQITNDYTQADTQLRTDLTTLINNASSTLQVAVDSANSNITALQQEVTDLTNRVTTLEQNSGSSTGSTGGSTGGTTGGSGGTTDNSALIAQLQQQITTDETTISTLANQMQTQQAAMDLLSQRLTVLSHRSVNVSSKGWGNSDYLITGGMAAGTTALGVGIYSILNQPDKTVVPDNAAKEEPRPGFSDKNTK